MKNNHKIKLIAASLALTTSFSAVGGLGGLNVQSNLGEPFSGTVTVTGEEARILLNGGNASLSDGSLRASVRKSGNNAVINIRSNAPVNDPVLVFQVGVGSQSRQYTAIIDPADYPAESSSSAGTQPESRTQTAPAQTDETGIRAETQQSAAARAKLKAKKAQEQQARKEQQKAAAAAREKLREQTAAERKSEPPRGNYKVSRGETLTSIANQIRPSGLSLRETIAAIMTANPEIFPTRNANQILAGRVLNIPSSEELKRLAKQPVPAAQEQAAQASQPDTAASAPAETAAPASAPVTDTTTAAASAAPQASEPATAAASSTASEPAAATSSPAATAQPAQPASEESSGLWRWLLFAGLGAIALWLLLKLAGKKKAAVEGVTEGSKEIIVKDTDTDSDDEYETLEPTPETEIRTHQPVAYPSGEAKSSAGTTAAAATVTAAAAATVAATKTEDDGLDMEDDFDDIFFSEAEAAPVEKTEGNFNLDLGSIDGEQGGIVSGALTQDEETQKREHADWDNIESTESVYEPETENEFQHVAVEFNADEDADSNQETTVIAESEPADSAKATFDDAPLEFYTEQAAVDAVTGQAAPDDKEQAEEPSLVQIEPTTAPESVAETVEIDTLSFTAETDAATAETVTDQSSLAVEIAEDADTSAVAAIETTPAEDHAAIEATTESAWTAATPQDDGFAFQDGEDFGATVNLPTDDAETIEWESINVEGDSRSDDGFISESVGMTAPLEAKYELAQMYVEIGDPEAARETLQELLEESSGTILEKTKAMLAELDK
ncbi:FimV/HubP family polar landmark protein [Neisseria dentiae]|uniref:FimV/HubP family polar landmark protein n=1 Tax=Neisseria dentiae TaxID=194197 RepID=UPI00211C1D58|nr:FimV/HubP family polar landmark protein [Neisseria dentiae]MCQ9326039.1 LysM peptidoglycan-binding domain-containing protein [Neisseria dentiae]